VIPAVALTLGLAACSKPFVARDLSKDAPKVLVIAWDGMDGYGPGIKQLLERCKIPVQILTPNQASPTTIREFDLLVLTGAGQTQSSVPECDRPVLSIGNWGYYYFGLLHLKIGYPFA